MLNYFKYLIISLFLFSIANIDATAIEETPTWDRLTYQYTPSQLEYLKQIPKNQNDISSKQLEQLTVEVQMLLKSTPLSGLEQTIIPPYLANAQKDFAWLSYLLTGELKGNLGPVTLWTLQLLIPNASLSSVTESDFDLYSSSLAAVVLEKTTKRLFAEKDQIADYPIKKGADLWTPTSPGYTGLNFGSMKTWYLDSSKDFLADAPPTNQDYWGNQCNTIKEEYINLDDYKIRAVYEWAGMAGHEGSWERIFNDYVREKNLPVLAELNARALFLSSLADSNAAAFNSKYTFWVKRPSQKDHDVKPLIAIPNHPSYPSAHSTIGGTAEAVLSTLFPEDKAKWEQLAEEAGMSRIWGGIHYPCDHEVGLKLGRKVGQKSIEKSEGKISSTRSGQISLFKKLRWF